MSIRIKTAPTSCMVYEATRMSPFSTPGCNYLKTLPLSSRGRVGESHDQAEPIGILNNVCSNITLMDYGLFKARYPRVVIHKEPKVEINGIGSVQSLGFARIPIWMEGIHHEGGVAPLNTECLIRMTIEVYLIPNFSHGVQIGPDIIKDYRIDFLISRNLGSIEDFT